MSGHYSDDKGRQHYIAADGTELQRKFMYWRHGEWAVLYKLAADSGMPLARLLLQLARQERDRRKDEYQCRIDALS